MERALMAPCGSPPRVWGQLVLPAQAFQFERFTPTRVGTMPTIGSRGGTTSVHPHACGDNVVVTDPDLDEIGSPPRVWGQ